jgi:hypothetical protein
MDNNNEFFSNLNSNISNARNRKTLRILEKQGRRYVVSIPSYADKKIKKDAKRQLNYSLKLIRRKSKQIK